MSDFLSFIVVEHIRFFHGALQLFGLSFISDWIFSLIFGLRENSYETEGQTKLLSSLPKFMQTRSRTRVSSKN